jgi:hypothetical protein
LSITINNGGQKIKILIALENLDVIPDGLTTCDLCSWASNDKPSWASENHQGIKNNFKIYFFN